MKKRVTISLFLSFLLTVIPLVALLASNSAYVTDDIYTVDCVGIDADAQADADDAVVFVADVCLPAQVYVAARSGFYGRDGAPLEYRLYEIRRRQFKDSFIQKGRFLYMFESCHLPPLACGTPFATWFTCWRRVTPDRTSTDTEMRVSILVEMGIDPSEVNTSPQSPFSNNVVLGAKTINGVSICPVTREPLDGAQLTCPSLCPELHAQIVTAIENSPYDSFQRSRGYTLCEFLERWYYIG